jgi:hypothetical protein
MLVRTQVNETCRMFLSALRFGIARNEVTGDFDNAVEMLGQELRKDADRFMSSLLLHNVCLVYW